MIKAALGIVIAFVYCLSARAHDLRSECADIQPLVFKDNLFFIDTSVTDKSGKAVRGRFLFDTGYSVTSFSKQFCEKLHCKVIGKRPLGPSDSYNYLAPMRLTMAGKEYALGAPGLDNSATLYVAGADGVIGGDVILKHELIVNLKDRYVCFPKKSVFELAEQLKFKKILAQYDAGRIWIGFEANGKKIDDYFLDTGSDATSLLKKDIENLHLSPTGTENAFTGGQGTLYTRKMYGPVSINLNGLSSQLGSIHEAHDDSLRKLGNDVLSRLVIGIDSELKYVFLSE